MKVEELRIGNWIKDGHEFEQIKIEHLVCLSSGRCEFDPIPLTEEWLLKFGFDKGNYKEINEKHFVKKSNTIKVIISGVGFWDVYTDYNPYQITFSNGLNVITDNRGVNHVHQLQNLYFALTGEELTLKR